MCNRRKETVKELSGVSRRDLLKFAMSALGVGLASRLIWPAQLLAEEYSEADRGSRVYWARLKHEWVNVPRPPSPWGPMEVLDWAGHPSADVIAIREIRRATDININPNWNVVDVRQLDKMVKYPFIFIHGELPASLSQNDQKNIVEYLKRGGFLFIDDCVLDPSNPRQADLFYQSMVKYMKIMLPAAKWERLQPDHEVFHNVFDMPRGLPHMQGIDRGLTAVYDGNRAVAMLCSSDIHCGWVPWFGQAKQRESLRMMVNIFSYAMTH